MYQAPNPRSSCRRNEAASEGKALVKPVIAVYLNDRIVWFYDCFATERSLVPSAAATGFLPIVKPC